MTLDPGSWPSTDLDDLVPDPATAELARITDETAVALRLSWLIFEVLDGAGVAGVPGDVEHEHRIDRSVQ